MASLNLLFACAREPVAPAIDARSDDTAPPAPTAESPSVASAGAAPETAAAAVGEQSPAPRVEVAAGRITIGDHANPSAAPPFEIVLDGFAIDRDLVTVERFAAFVAASGYRTEAEDRGGAVVFDPETRELAWRDGARWSHPAARDGQGAFALHPVTQVTQTDAEAFCAWAGGRLPTEFEWEFAARNAGLAPATRYPWGDSFFVDGRFMANTWQGIYPVRNTMQDGYLATSPVGAFGPTPIGLHDMAGNVWQRTSSHWAPYDAEGSSSPDPGDRHTVRGGSFLCEPSACDGAISTSRRGVADGEARADIGFRCVYGGWSTAGSR